MYRQIVAILFLFTCAVSAAEEIKVEMLSANHEDMPCEVYFFKSWATYQHPVKPIDPVEYETALQRDGFYRAWLCKKSGKDVFAYFEGIENMHSITKYKKPDGAGKQAKFYRLKEDGAPGSEIAANDTIGMSEFYVSLPQVGEYLLSIKQKKSISYQYVYDNNGKPVQAIITGFDGKVSTIDL